MQIVKIIILNIKSMTKMTIISIHLRKYIIKNITSIIFQARNIALIKMRFAKTFNVNEKKNHIIKNCTTKEKSKYRNKSNNNIDNVNINSFITSKKHLKIIQINIFITTSSTLSLIKLEWITLNKVNFLFIIWIINSKVICHCTSNKSLFIQNTLKFINEIINMINDKILFIKIISNVKIKLFNDKNIVLCDVMYISTFICNFLNQFKLHTRNWTIIYSKEQFCTLYNFDDEFVTKANLIQNLCVFRNVKMIKLNHIEIVIKFQLITLKSSINVENMSIFAFFKFIIDIKI